MRSTLTFLFAFLAVTLITACGDAPQPLDLEDFRQPIHIDLEQVQPQEGTLNRIKRQGFINCGIGTNVLGFSFLDDAGRWTGIDADFCRAIAAALFNNPRAVKFVPLSARDRFSALNSGKIDLLARNTTWTASRDVAMGISFIGTLYYDGQGFLVQRNAGIKTATQLKGKTTCVLDETTSEPNLLSFYVNNNIKDYELLSFQTVQEMIANFELGRCDTLSSDQSQLYSIAKQLSDPFSAYVLPEVISKEPLAPAVRNDDDAWFKIVRWVLYAMIAAEELGIHSKNVNTLRVNGTVQQKQFLGIGHNPGTKIDLDAMWAFRIVSQVGNYEEIFARNLGAESRLGIKRGLNALWRDGGLHYAPPLR